MPLYRKKPIVIDAVQYNGDNFDELHDFVGDSLIHKYSAVLNIHTVEIKTLEGVMHADPRDWIVKGVKGEFYPVKPEIFNMTYDLVT